MILIFKIIILFLAVFIASPIVFFLLIKVFGKFFNLKIDKDSWLFKIKSKF